MKEKCKETACSLSDKKEGECILLSTINGMGKTQWEILGPVVENKRNNCLKKDELSKIINKLNRSIDS